MNVKLLLTYDGTGYLGWQKTRMGPSIEQELEKALEKILQMKVYLQAASRTDAGVHAREQVVNFFMEKETVNLSKLKYALNCLLPKSIAISDACLAPHAFHPTLDCIGKTYRYRICNSQIQSPFSRLYSWHYPYALDIDLMKKGSVFFVGEKDFSAFCNKKKNEEYLHTVREVKQIEIEMQGHQLCIEITGNHFLYKMVRNIVGTLVYAGCGKLKPEEIPRIITSHDRTLAGMTAPAHGLTLFKVHYPMAIAKS